MRLVSFSRLSRWRVLAVVLAGFVSGPVFAQTSAADVVLQLAREARADGNLARAREYLDDLISRVPNHVNAHFERAQLLKDTGDVAGARADLDHVLALNPKAGNALTLRAKWRLEAADYAGAITDSLASGGGAENVETRGYARLALGKHEEALEDFTRLRSGSPYTSVRYAQGLCWLALDRLDDAVGAFISDFHDYGSTEARKSLVLSYCIQGNTTAAEKEANDWINEASQPAPTDDYDKARWQAVHDDVDVAHYLRGVIRFAQNDFSGAADLLAKISSDSSMAAYARLLQHAARLRAKSPGDVLAAGDAWKHEWAQALRSYLTGGLTEKALLAKAAEETDIAERRRFETEACFYAAQKRFAADDELTANLLLEKAVGVRKIELSEYALAKVALRSR